jgi:hypothetical protein
MAVPFKITFNSRRDLLWVLMIVLMHVCSGSHFGEHLSEDVEWEQWLDLRAGHASMSMLGEVPGPKEEVPLKIGIECDGLDSSAGEYSYITEGNFAEALGDTSCSELWNVATSSETPLSTTATLLFLVCVRVSLIAIALQVCETGQLGPDEPEHLAIRKLQGTPLARLGAELVDFVKKSANDYIVLLSLQVLDENFVSGDRAKEVDDRVLSFGKSLFDNFLFATEILGETFTDCDGNPLTQCSGFCQQWLLVPEGLKLAISTEVVIAGVTGAPLTGGLSFAVPLAISSAIIAADLNCARCTRQIESRGDCSPGIDFDERGCETQLSCAGFRNSCRYRVREPTKWYTITSSTGGQCTMAPDGSPDIEVESYNDITEPENVNWSCSSLIAKRDVPYLPSTQPGVMELCPKGDRPLLLTPENCGPTNVQIVHSFGSYRIEGAVGGLLDSNTALWSRDCDVTGASADCPSGGTVYVGFEGSPCCKLPDETGGQVVDCTCGTIGPYLFWSAPCIGQFNDPPTGDVCIGDPGRCFG